MGTSSLARNSSLDVADSRFIIDFVYCADLAIFFVELVEYTRFNLWTNCLENECILYFASMPASYYFHQSSYS